MKGTPRVVERPRRSARAAEFSAVGAFALFVTVVLLKSLALLEPDDYAYRASIVALSHGQILLTNTQYIALRSSLTSNAVPGVLQWHHIASGYWISEKNPGYPSSPSCSTPWTCCDSRHCSTERWPARESSSACDVGCLSAPPRLRCGSTASREPPSPSRGAPRCRRSATPHSWPRVSVSWCGCSSRQTPRIVDASGWAWAPSSPWRCAVFIRYTNAARARRRRRSASPCSPGAAPCAPRRSLSWGSTVVVLVVLVLGFDQWVYGSATSTGYSAGEITFSLCESLAQPQGHALEHLTTSMPMWLLAAAALVVIAARRLAPSTRRRAMTRCA